MSFAERFNKSASKFKLATAGFEYRKLSECYNAYGKDHVYVIGAVYINTKNTYGANPVVAVREGYYVNLPVHLCKTCEEMLKDDAIVADINKGICGFTIYTYPSHGKQCYGVKWVDVPQGENTEELPPQEENTEARPPF